MPVKKTTKKEKAKTLKQTKSISSANKQEEKSKSTGFDFMRFGESYTSLILGIIVVVIATVLLLSYVHGKNSTNSQQQILAQQTVSQQSKVTQTVKNTGVPAATNAVTPKATATSTPKATVTTVPTVVPTQGKSGKSLTPTITQPVQSGSAKLAVKSRKVQKQQEYIVQKGDSLWTIAVKEYNNGYDWVQIARANNLDNPGTIFSGNALVIPSIEQQNSTTNIARAPNTELASANKSKSTNVSSDPVSVSNAITVTTYTIVKGDSLWSIAVRAYGDGYQWVKIAHANNLTNPGIINCGNVLSIPRG